MKFQRITSSIVDNEPTEHDEDLRETARQDAARPPFRDRPGAIKKSPFVQSDS